MKTIRWRMLQVLTALACTFAAVVSFDHLADAALRASHSIDDIAPWDVAAPTTQPASLGGGMPALQAPDHLSIEMPAILPEPPHNGLFTDVSPADRACLARAIYFEARGEIIDGQVAVAQVILNRVAAGRWRPTICGVVNQGIERGSKCQFSFACWASSRRALSGPAWEQAQVVADAVLSGTAALQSMLTATHYHRSELQPIWRHRLVPIEQVGAHTFYADPRSDKVRPSIPVAVAAQPVVTSAAAASHAKSVVRQVAWRPQAKRSSTSSAGSGGANSLDWAGSAFSR
jgi:Cell Wall Hydrolase